MGGAVSLSTPISGNNQKILAEKYKVKSEAGMDDESINRELSEALPSIILFNQVDCDHSGSVSLKELKRMLKSLPRKKPTPPEGGWPGGSPPPYMTVDEMFEKLDTNKDGAISMDEWIDNIAMDEMAGLKAAIKGALDPTTGKIVGYQSLEARLGELMEERAKIDKQIESIKKAVGSAGVVVFKQIDLDKSGTIEKKELLRVLKQLPKPKEIKGPRMSIEEIMAALDVDGDGTINEEEWLAKLEVIPTLKASIEEAVGPDGKIKGYRSLENQLWKLGEDLKKLEQRVEDGEDGPALLAEIEKKKQSIKKLEDKG
eukprot:CAMPEP_0118636174 /NCGR_PEP_ID=MMETSP0785-20121206/2473_1 /TAXON_ID=91992 /ORGANISM="Bolidomonas pacifica, Strain CCMP 1866" /LENGTH=313 /DNA_ID=CAMNT_0006527265 /DNA_START=1 /DNA_END=939 /DNA_ORIENTATION=-